MSESHEGNTNEPEENNPEDLVMHTINEIGSAQYERNGRIFMTEKGIEVMDNLINAYVNLERENPGALDKSIDHFFNAKDAIIRTYQEFGLDIKRLVTFSDEDNSQVREFDKILIMQQALLTAKERIDIQNQEPESGS